MKYAIVIVLAVFMVASSAADLEPQVELTNKPSASTTISNSTVMVESGGTNQPAKDILAKPEVVEASKYAAIWNIVVALATVGVTWGATKIPHIPSRIIPILTPIIGVGIGFLLEYANGLNLPWWDKAQAGALAVMIQQTWKHNVTMPMEDRAEKDAMDKISRTPPDQPIP